MKSQVPPAAYENVPAVVEIVEMEMASQTKGIQKRASSDSGEDLRRLRNNEASRKSRQNRRERLTGQVSMLSQLEKENQQLIVKVKELEQLKSEMMKYLKKDGPWTNGIINETEQNKIDVSFQSAKLPFQHSTYYST